MSIDSQVFSIDKEHIKEVLDFLPYPFLIAESRAGVYHNIYVNQKFKLEIGYTCDEMPTIDDWFRLAYPDTEYRAEVISKWNERFLAAKREGLESAQMKVQIHTRHSGNCWYEVKSSIKHEGVQLVAFINIHDVVTKERELLRINENKNQVLSVLTHDLRSPLNSLHSITLLAGSGRLASDEFLDLIRTLNERSRQTLDLLDTTLLWAKSNFEHIQVKKEEVFVSDVIDSILQVSEASLSKKEIQVRVQLDEKNPSSDAEMVSIIVRNLISNAIKFTMHGGIIDISSNWVNNRYHLRIKDSGIGMSKELVEKIFQQQNQSQHGTHKEKGHGIGLRLSQQLIQKINGNLEIESEPGSGTKMCVIL
jgi:signal transduction histidine kinase